MRRAAWVFVAALVALAVVPTIVAAWIMYGLHVLGGWIEVVGVALQEVAAAAFARIDGAILWVESELQARLGGE